MNKSESIIEFAKAFALAQPEFGGAKKDSKNPYFKSSYSDLASVWEAANHNDALSKNGLSVVQVTGKDEYGTFLETILLHTSGEYISGKLYLAPVKEDPQGIGSAITYARRYGLQAILGIAPEDDDGEGAMGRAEEAKVPFKAPVEAKSPVAAQKPAKAIPVAAKPDPMDKERPPEPPVSAPESQLSDREQAANAILEKTAALGRGEKWVVDILLERKYVAPGTTELIQAPITVLNKVLNAWGFFEKEAKK